MVDLNLNILRTAVNVLKFDLNTPALPLQAQERIEVKAWCKAQNAGWTHKILGQILMSVRELNCVAKMSGINHVKLAEHFRHHIPLSVIPHLFITAMDSVRTGIDQRQCHRHGFCEYTNRSEIMSSCTNTVSNSGHDL
jgi:hypothetical protein